MHILFLTDNFPPEVNAPASRTFEHCREWVKQGVKVTVITSAPNFPKGKLTHGYKNKLWQTEVVEGIHVVRVKTYIAANKGSIKRIFDFLSFMFSATFASFFIRKVDVIVATSPQFFTAVAGFTSSKLKGVPWVFELRDIWPESIVTVGSMQRGLLIALLEKIEKFLYKNADLIVPVTTSFSKYLIDLGVEKNKIHVVTNGIDHNIFFKQQKNQLLLDELRLENQFIVGYIGTHGLAHSLETIIQAALLCEKDPLTKDVYFLFVGDGAEKDRLEKIADDLNIQNVMFLPSVSKNKISDFWSILDVTIIHLKNQKLFRSVIPSKLFEAIGMGIPVLLGLKGEAADLTLKFSVGQLFEPEDPKMLYESIRNLKLDPVKLQQMQESSRIATKQFSRVNLANDMLNQVSNIAKRK